MLDSTPRGACADAMYAAALCQVSISDIQRLITRPGQGLPSPLNNSVHGVRLILRRVYKLDEISACQYINSAVWSESRLQTFSAAFNKPEYVVHEYVEVTAQVSRTGDGKRYKATSSEFIQQNRINISLPKTSQRASELLMPEVIGRVG